MPDVFDPKATNSQHLRYLIAVADAGSFRRAADTLYVSQPSLSAAIAQWERRMDCTVFERGARGAQPTPIGERVVAAAREALAALEQLERVAEEAAPPFYGPVRFGVIPTIGPYALPFVHQAIADQLADLSLPVQEATTAALLHSLDTGQIDVAMVAVLSGMRERYHVAPLYHEPFHASLPQQHALSGAEELTADQLAAAGLLLLDEGHCLREQTLELCSLHREGSSGPGYRATSLETLRHLVVAGHGVTVVPALAMGQPHTGEALRPLANQASRTVALLWRRNDPRAEAYDLLRSVLRKHIPRQLVQPA